MFIVKNEEHLNNLFEKTKNLYGNLNNNGIILMKFMVKKIWAPYIIDSVKGTFRERGSVHAE